jgi:uncharacterized protein (DUF2147 family)
MRDMNPIRRSSFPRTVLLGGALAALTAASQAQAPAPMATPSGHWRVVEDDTVLEFLPCANDAAARCALVRGLPKQVGKDDVPPACGEQLGLEFKPEPDGQRWAGKIYDHIEQKTYRGRLRPGKDGGLDLIVVALGGLYTETIPLAPAGSFKACAAGG